MDYGDTFWGHDTLNAIYFMIGVGADDGSYAVYDFGENGVHN